MGEVIQLTTRLDGINQVQKGLKNVGRSLNKLERDTKTATRKLADLGNSLGRIGRGLTIGLTLPLVAATGVIAKFGINAVESENLFEKSMGDMAKEARAFSETLSTQLNLNAFETRKSIGVFNQMLVSMTGNTEASFGMAKGLTQLTTDMASFFNLNSADAFQKLQAGITGEIEPLKRLGIIVSETTVRQELMNRGLVSAGEMLTENQKIIGRYLTIMRQTSNAQGDMADTLEDPANRLRALGAETKEAATQLGITLLPAIGAVLGALKRLVEGLKSLVEGFQNLEPWQKGAALLMLGIAASIGPVLKGFSLLIKGFLALRVAVIAIATPIGLIVAGIAALVAVGTLLAFSWRQIAQLAKSVWAGVVRTVLEATVKILGALEGLTRPFKEGIADSIALTRQQVENLLKGLPVQTKTATEAAVDVWDSMFDNLKALVGKMKNIMASPFETMTKEQKDSFRELERSYAESLRSAESFGRSLRRDSTKTTKQLERDARQLSDTRESKAREFIGRIKEETRNLKDQRTFLLVLQRRYQELGEEGAAALDVVNGRLKELGKELELRTFGGGAKNAAREYFEGIQNQGAIAANFVGSSFQSLEDALANFFETGKLSFDSFFDAIKSGLARSPAQEVIGTIGNLLSGLFGGGGSGSIIGGLVGGARDIIGGFFAEGGLIRGPGNDKSDNILGLLSPGEFVLKADAVRKLGASRLAILNSGGIPRFASGGEVDPNAVQGAVDFLQATQGDQEFANSFGTQIEAGLEPGAALHFSSLAFLGRSLNRDMANMLTGLKTFLNLFGGPFASQLFGLVQRNAVRNVRAGRPAFAIGGSDVTFNEIGGVLPAMRSAEIENLQNTTSAMGGGVPFRRVPEGA